jgi:alpha-1,2-mannosyltransferase
LSGDLRALPAGRWAGVGVGLAAAIKLTPAVFIGYLLLSRQYRAAATATVTAAAATLLAAILAPGQSRTFWTSALWDTGRVGRLEYVSNQSLRGLLARLDAPSTWWLLAVALVLAYWCWWIRVRQPAAGHLAGFALTGIVACLISPITWVHHLVWLLPALFLLLDRALPPTGPPAGRRLAGLVAVFIVLSSSVVWLWWSDPYGWGSFAGSNAYVWVTLTLLFAVTEPARRPLTDLVATPR